MKSLIIFLNHTWKVNQKSLGLGGQESEKGKKGEIGLNFFFRFVPIRYVTLDESGQTVLSECIYLLNGFG
jgi:hypothetical protein